MKLDVAIEHWELKVPFRIAGKTWHESSCILVTLQEGATIGRGEAQGVSYLGEDPESLLAQVEAVRARVENGINREELQSVLPRGGARNALDCALWDLEAKLSGRSIWELTGITPGPVTTVFTIGLEKNPAEMAAKASAAHDCPILKVKLDDDRPLERLQAIRGARPDARIVVDANQGWNFAMLQDILPACAELRIDMIEQPLPRGDDDALQSFRSPVPLAADESCQDTAELDTAASRYEMINIKLDKTGGLTEALRLAEAARGAGCRLMVGNMLGTSLSMAPSFVVAQLCDFADIDGPLLMKSDRAHGLRYNHGQAQIFGRNLWG
ncbi:MAG: dipeptide epimerase [Woeseia sp.]|nr:dipeptide epimerase [Woeseia sp.]MBT8095446.1 dipeptide epimerase [Woeseia sp.]NNE61403.1 dipeptide epimerase [Woeseia sp.]NNL55246.1 dipeptide epimerase [Woeseia sp.]